MFTRVANRISQIGYLKNKPRVIFRILTGMMKSMVLRRPVLRNIQLAVCYECNQNCESCFAVPLLSNKKKRMTLPEMKRIWDEVEKLGVIHVDITGGEPLLWGIDKLAELLRYITKKRDILISLDTNGTLLNNDVLRKLRDAGLDLICFNLQSLNKDRHDKIAGRKGSFQKVMQGIDCAQALQVPTIISTMFTQDNYDDVRAIANFCRQKRMFLSLLPLATVTKSRKQSQSEARSKQIYHNQYYQLLRMRNVRVDSMFSFRTFLTACPQGIEKWYITIYGDVMPCPFVQIFFGNLLEESAGTIYRRMCSFPPVRKFSRRCKHFFDNDYIETWIKPVLESKGFPISIFDHPNLSLEQRRLLE